MDITAKLSSLGLKLPEAAAPVGAYVPAVVSGKYVYTAGQLPLADGTLRYSGKVGMDVTVEDGYAAARLCVLNALAAVKAAVGDLQRVRRVVKVTGFVNSAPGFTGQAVVLNGASELLAALFAEGHARSAVGVAALPLNAAVEVELMCELDRE
ncbi:MAG TPA: RidA family protein [Firmicutes bacterium]|nr:RidA family protein [Bacillota bacterium]